MPTKTRETSNAIFYEVPRDNTATILSAISSASQSVTQQLLKRQLEIAAMKQAFSQMDPDAQKQLYESWSEKDRKKYGISPRSKTEAESARERTSVAQASVAEAEVGRQGLVSAQLQQQVDAGKLTLDAAKRKQQIIDDPTADLWDKALLGLDLRGDDAERYVLNKKYPGMADDLLQIRNKRGAAYEKTLVGEYFRDLVKENGTVDPKYTLLTAQALAKSVANGDPSGLDELNKDKGWPASMRTLAYQRFKLDVDQMHEARANRLSSENQTRAQLAVRLMELSDGTLPADAANQGAGALLQNKDVPEWTRPFFASARQMANETKAAQAAKLSLDIREKVSGIPEIRSGIETLQKLQKDDLGGNNKEQIKKLRNEMIQRMAKLYDIDATELQDKEGMWSRAFNGVVGFVGAGAQTGAALAGDALSGDSLLDAIASDSTPGAAPPNDPSVIGGRPMPPGHGSMDLRMQSTPAAPGGRTAAVPGAPAPRVDRKAGISAKVDSLLAEFPQASPARQAAIKALLERIKQDPDGLAVLGEK